MTTKVYIHERAEAATCQFSWAEHDTKAPHEVRHECNRSVHPTTPARHVCTCGLVEDAA